MEICVLAAACCASAFGQAVIQEKWTGTWKLDIQHSALAKILIPGLSVGATIVSQTLKIERAEGKLRLSGYSVFSDSSRSYRDDDSLSLDGKGTVTGPVALSFRPIDDYTFEIVGKLTAEDKSAGEVSRFVFSSDGRTLTETKVQIVREVPSGGEDRSQEAVIRTSRFVLVFHKA